MNLPNALSLFRLLLVPVFPILYFSPYGRFAVWVFVLATFTDVLDGFLARRLGQVTKLGRLLDPLADKLMSGTVLISLSIDNIAPWWVAVVFCAKELLMGIGALVQFRRIDDVPAAKFYGKASAVLFFLVLVALMLFPIPRPWPEILLGFALFFMLIAFLLYLKRYIHMWNENKSNPAR